MTEAESQSAPSNIAHPEQVLEYWFGLEHRDAKDDERIRETLSGVYARARDGGMEMWLREARARLALVILLDQVPRHLFRGQPASFFSDVSAQGAALRFMTHRDWDKFNPLESYYAVAPFLHAEDLFMQEKANPIIHRLAGEDPRLVPSAAISDLYVDIIRRFRRFPHRNEILGRDSTPDELAFLENEWGQRLRTLYKDEEAGKE